MFCDEASEDENDIKVNFKCQGNWFAKVPTLYHTCNLIDREAFSFNFDFWLVKYF